MIKKISAKKIARILALSNKGLSQRKIAKKVGCSRGGVYYHLHR